MVEETVAMAIISFTYFYLSAANTVSEKFRYYFMLLGFLNIIGTIAVGLTAAGERTMAAMLWGNVSAFVLFVTVNLLYFVGEVLLSIQRR